MHYERERPQKHQHKLHKHKRRQASLPMHIPWISFLVPSLFESIVFFLLFFPFFPLVVERKTLVIYAHHIMPYTSGLVIYGTQPLGTLLRMLHHLNTILEVGVSLIYRRQRDIVELSGFPQKCKPR
jgi:hypothetical protein